MAAFLQLRYFFTGYVMHWDDLRIIASVRNKGTYAKAGKDLRIDGTTVARRLARIQKTLGFTLFDAIDGLRKPTLQCEAVLAYVDEMARAVVNIDAIGGLETGPVGNIRVTSTASIAEEFLAPELGDFLATHPGLSLELQTSNDNLNFSHWETDLAIRLGQPVKGNYAIRKLGNIKFILFRPKTTSQDQKQFVCAYPKELDDTPEMQELRSTMLSKQTRLKTSNIRIIRSVVKSQKGIGVLPEHLATDLLEDEDIIATPLKSYREAWLLMQPHLKTDTAARLVIDWIVRQFGVLGR